MTVKKLIEELDRYDDDMEVLIDRYSDYERVSQVSIIEGVDEKGWISRRVYPLADGTKPKSKRFVHIG